MEEKKLTDEEVIKALEVCYTAPCCTNECPYFNKNGRNFCKEKGVYNDLKDLIHRLQDENADLREKRMDAEFAIDKWMEENKKQQEEIERLTEKVENQKAVIKGQNKAIEKEKSENKRLYDEYVRLDDFCAGKGCLCCICECKETCNECAKCGSLKTEKCKGFRIDVSKYARAIERADKLQKQVNELKEERENMEAEIIAMDEARLQAVKDTAKEILDELDLFFKGTTFRKGYEFKKINEKLKEIAQRRGVEVE